MPRDRQAVAILKVTAAIALSRQNMLGIGGDMGDYLTIKRETATAY